MALCSLLALAAYLLVARPVECAAKNSIVGVPVKQG
jgi:hypothetical protein